MKVIIKKPKMEQEIVEVEGISEINKLVGNVDENGDGYNHGGSDIRMSIGKKVDLYCNEHALFNAKLKGNLWINDNSLICGTIVFAGYDQDKKEECGACSLTQDQIDFCMEFIARQCD